MGYNLEITEFFRGGKTVTLEKEGVRLKLTFKEWQGLAKAYRFFVDKSF